MRLLCTSPLLDICYIILDLISFVHILRASCDPNLHKNRTRRDALFRFLCPSDTAQFCLVALLMDTL